MHSTPATVGTMCMSEDTALLVPAQSRHGLFPCSTWWSSCSPLLLPQLAVEPQDSFVLLVCQTSLKLRLPLQHKSVWALLHCSAAAQQACNCSSLHSACAACLQVKEASAVAAIAALDAANQALLPDLCRVLSLRVGLQAREKELQAQIDQVGGGAAPGAAHVVHVTRYGVTSR